MSLIVRYFKSTCTNSQVDQVDIQVSVEEVFSTFLYAQYHNGINCSSPNFAVPLPEILNTCIVAFICLSLCTQPHSPEH